jgi:hypothetical protein
MTFILREVEHMTTSSTPYNHLALGGITLKQFGSCNALIPGEIRDRLKSRFGNEDQLLVIDISGDAAGWVGVNESGRTWLEANI